MTDELIGGKLKQNFCRLCLAPSEECIPIFNNFAADKEPLSSKIHACVNIKVNQSDKLSSRVCHACVSYLNSWQSFKNRCLASQVKQKKLLEATTQQKSLNNALMKQNEEFHSDYGFDSPSNDINLREQNGENQDVASSLKSSTKPWPVPIKIKEEPKDPSNDCENEPDGINDTEESMKIDIDPSEFLERRDEEDADEDDQLELPKPVPARPFIPPTEGPQILTSLGLTHIKSVNPYTFLSTELGSDMSSSVELNEGSHYEQNSEEIRIKSHHQQQLQHLRTKSNLLPICRVCKLTFSTRANARRHERNIHGKMLLNPANFKSLTKTSSNVKPSQAQLTPEMLGIYDYKNPEKYRHLLTEQKILFIRKNEEFLKQYQTLTCKCCTKTFPTYKNFMAHMRKKYPNIGRSLCFKCLKQFPSKALFISHLKKRNCINLYKIYISDDGISKEINPDRTSTKYLLANKVYECKICMKGSRLKTEFRSHVYEDHSDIQRKDVPSGQCAFCGIIIEDPVERKRHYNNMECIVNLRCITCDEKFEKHQKFVDHVYETHLPPNTIRNVPVNDDVNDGVLFDSMPSRKLTHEENENYDNEKESEFSMNEKALANSSDIYDSRAPQSCKICGLHYNNYNNVLRHMEAKHPDQLPPTYQCTKCDLGYPRLSLLRHHMLEAHGSKVPKRKKVRNFLCRICSQGFPDREKWIGHQTDLHQRYACCHCSFQQRDLNEFKKHIETHPSLSISKKGVLLATPNDSNDKKSMSQGEESSSSLSKPYSSRFDYVMRDLLLIQNGGVLPDENNMINITNKENTSGKQVNKREATSPTGSNSARKRMRLDTTIRECKVCHMTFTGNLGLSNHMRIHNAEQIKRTAFGIEGAGKSLATSVDPRFRRIRCRMCQKRFSNKKSYRKHMIVIHQVENVHFIRCKLCNAEFAQEKGLKVHMYKVHGTFLSGEKMELEFECDLCTVICKTKDELNTHKLAVHGGDEDIDYENEILDREEIVDNEGAGDENAAKLIKENPSSFSGRNSNVNNSPNSMEDMYWFQCRYCPAHFNTNKKLAIHINSHEEFDSNDYSCKDCGNVYSGRKSLWVHRYKKHPLIPDPAPCPVCKKLFFDKNMLEFHMKCHKGFDQKKVNRLTSQSQNANPISTGDDENIDNELSDNENAEEDEMTGKKHEKLLSRRNSLGMPEVRCTICSAKFTDQELFSKHIELHEKELYTDDPLAAMLDVLPEDPNKMLMNRLSENGEFQCDICTKSFPTLTALKVHRNWHFRDSTKQPSTESNGGRSSNPKKKRVITTPVTGTTVTANGLKCEYCSSTFSNTSNLRRHITEFHKIVKNIEKSHASLKEKENSFVCEKCNTNFKTNQEWIKHKINHIKSDSTLQENSDQSCDICNKVFNSRELLVDHILKAHSNEESNEHVNGDNHPGFRNENHKEKVPSIAPESTNLITKKPWKYHATGDDDYDDFEEEENEDESVNNKMENHTDEDNNDEYENEGEDDYQRSPSNEESSEEHATYPSKETQNKSVDDINRKDNSDRSSDTEDEDTDDENNDSLDDHDNEGTSESDDENDDISSEENNSEDDEEEEEELEEEGSQAQFSCDLCQLFFDSSQDLQQHVASHFFNGPGSVTLSANLTK